MPIDDSHLRSPPPWQTSIHCISEFLQIDNDVGAGLRQAVNETIQAVDDVHRVFLLPPIGIAGSRAIGSFGCYDYARTKLRREPDRPSGIAISVFSPHPRLTLAHEIGHYLDNQCLNPARRGFASNDKLAFAELRKAWERSSAIRNLRRLHRGRGSGRWIVNHKYVAVCLQPREIWARSYAQWIAENSRCQPLADELKIQLNEIRLERPIMYNTQWEYDDFGTIGKAIGELFRSKGLMS